VTSEPIPAGEGGCPLCGVAVGADARRCPACGWSLAGVDGRPGPFSARTLWWTGAGFLAVYLITLAIVAFTH
jgi:hypothetical protein